MCAQYLINPITAEMLQASPSTIPCQKFSCTNWNISTCFQRRCVADGSDYGTNRTTHQKLLWFQSGTIAKWAYWTILGDAIWHLHVNRVNDEFIILHDSFIHFCNGKKQFFILYQHELIIRKLMVKKLFTFFCTIFPLASILYWPISICFLGSIFASSCVNSSTEVLQTLLGIKHKT